MITILQHGKEEGPGLISDLLAGQGEELMVVRMYEGELPDKTLPRGLIILGGPMSAADIGSYPYFLTEHEMIRSMAVSGRPVLGICLGAQLIAAAFGASVYPASIPEKGWYRVFREDPSADPEIPETMTVFQWHADTFDLPPGGRLMVRGDTVPNQMCAIGSATAVQFHPEVTPEMITGWTKSLPRKKGEGILAETPRNLKESRIFCEKLLRPFLKPEMEQQKSDLHHAGFSRGLPHETR